MSDEAKSLDQPELRVTKKVKQQRPKTQKKKIIHKSYQPMQEVLEIEISETAEGRTLQMCELRDKGLTFGDIANVFGLTRQRVHQLVSGVRDDSSSGPVKLGRAAPKKRAQCQNPETIGDRIVYKRIKLGWSLSKLAFESGVSYSVLSTYENNVVEPSCKSLRKLCLALQCSAHWLIFGQKYRKNPEVEAKA